MSETTIPDSALDTHVGVLGRTGTGKTYTARGLVERLLDARRQVVIVDPTGAWWGLRSVYPVPIFGGAHGDVAITDESGEAVARTIIESKTSAIVDLSLLARQSGAAMRRFMRAFIARLKDKHPGAIWLVLDEADEFLPQVLPPDMTQLFGDLKWLVRRGRIAGWRVMMITQRPQDIAKSVLTQIGTLVAHRLTAPQDRRAVEEWVKGHADPEEAKAVLSSLASLQTGEAWVWWPDGNLLVREAMPAIRSFDSGATPDAGTGEIEQPELTAIDMSAIRATLEGPKSDSQIATVLSTDSNRPCADCAAKDRQIDEILKRNAALFAELKESDAALERITKTANTALAALREISAPNETKSEGHGRVLLAPPPSAPSKPERPGPDKAGVIAGETAPKFNGAARPAASGLNAAARKMIDMLERIAPARVTWASLAAMVGNKPRGGNFNAARKAMRESGQIVEDGDTIRAVAPQFGDPLTREDARQLWKDVLSNPAPRMIDALDIKPMSKVDLGAFLGIVPRGGNFNNGIAQLIRNGLAVERAGVLHLAEPLPGEGA